MKYILVKLDFICKKTRGIFIFIKLYQAWNQSLSYITSFVRKDELIE